MTQTSEQAVLNSTVPT